LEVQSYVLGTRIVVACVFIVAGMLKLGADPTGHMSILESVGVKPRPSIRRLTAALPICEIVIGLWLLGNWQTAPALLAALCLLTLFSILVTTALLKGYQGSCGCFGNHSKRRLGVSDILFNVLLTLGTLVAFAIEMRLRSSLSVTSIGAAKIVMISAGAAWFFAVHAMVREIESVMRLLKENRL
jgi:putative oxidoreductase